MSGLEVVVRPYREDDLDDLIALFRETIRTVGRREYTQAQVEAWAPDRIDRAAWAARLPSRASFVAELDGAVAGFVEVEPDGHVDMLYVHAGHQGRGVATALLRRAESSAREAGARGFVTEASLIARPFFERRGYRVTERQEVTRRGQRLARFRMEKRPAAE